MAAQDHVIQDGLSEGQCMEVRLRCQAERSCRQRVTQCLTVTIWGTIITNVKPCRNVHSQAHGGGQGQSLKVTGRTQLVCGNYLELTSNTMHQLSQATMTFSI